MLCGGERISCSDRQRPEDHGLSADVLAELMTEVWPLRQARLQAKLATRPWKRAIGAGAKHRLVFVDRRPAALVRLRHAVTHDVLACWFSVDRSTLPCAIGEVRPLHAERRLPRSSTSSQPSRLPAPSTESRSASGARPPGARAGQVHLRQEQAERGQDHGCHGLRRPRPLLQSGSARQLRRHHQCPPVVAGQTSGRRTSTGDTRGFRSPGSGRLGRVSLMG
ncbi:transposase family protein [Streptomyces sp. NPDC017943]|uniref:transposase family protein n=1 Tax=Streptomyces sp. NPDC017943 TaxID=3365019 RepID=UPI0037B6CDF5